MANCNKLHRVLVYGTLREPNKNNEKITVKGTLYNLGWYPGFKSDPENGTEVVCEVLEEITDSRLRGFDSYEGYDPARPEQSLYLREWVEEHNAWIYVYNRSVEGYPVIETGDWETRERKKEEELGWHCY